MSERFLILLGILAIYTLGYMVGYQIAASEGRVPAEAGRIVRRGGGWLTMADSASYSKFTLEVRGDTLVFLARPR